MLKLAISNRDIHKLSPFSTWSLYKEEKGRYVGFSDLYKQVCEFPRMSERVDLPGDFRPAALAERVVQFAQAQTLLVNDFHVVPGRLIILHPAATDQLQLTLKIYVNKIFLR